MNWARRALLPILEASAIQTRCFACVNKLSLHSNKHSVSLPFHFLTLYLINFDCVVGLIVNLIFLVLFKIFHFALCLKGFLKTGILRYREVVKYTYFGQSTLNYHQSYYKLYTLIHSYQNTFTTHYSIALTCQ